MNRPASSPDLPGTGNDTSALSRTGDNEPLLLDVSPAKGFSIMLVLYLLWFLDFATRYTISPMFPLIKNDLGLSDTQLGLLSSIVLIAITLLSIPASLLIDRWRRGRLIAIMALIWSVASILSGMSANFYQLLFSRALLGVGEAAFASGGMAMISAIYRKSKRATITGIWNTAIPLGLGAGMAGGGLLAMHFGWRMSFVIAGIPGIILGIAAWFFPDYENTVKNVGGTGESILATLAELLKKKSLVMLYTSVAVFMCFSQAVSFWGATLLVRMFDFDIAQAGFFMGSQSILALVSAPLGGMIADRISRSNPSNKVRFCFASTLLTILFYSTGIMTKSVACLYISAFFSMFFLAAQMAATQEIVPAHQRATSYGVYVMAQYLLGGLWGPLLLGYISDTVSLEFAFVTVMSIGLIGCAGYLGASVFFNKDVADAREKDREYSRRTLSI